MEKNSGIIYVSRTQLVNGLAVTLKNYEKGDVVLVTGGSLNASDDQSSIKTFDIYVDKKQVFHEEYIYGQQYSGCVDNQDLITLASAYDLVEPLYGEFPYLEPIMNRVSYDMFLDNGKGIGEKMIDAAIWYEAYAPHTEDILTFMRTRRN
ncbi:MAG: hypothetical protein IJE53_01870 [Bacilli bacterium]|nr:hypothetical protein [Bacilli bacterium]